MMVKVYVDWDAHEILTANEHAEKQRVRVVEMMADEDIFNEWLEERYLPQAIWHMTEAGRTEVLTQWEQCCIETIEEDDEYEEDFIEI